MIILLNWNDASAYRLLIFLLFLTFCFDGVRQLVDGLLDLILELLQSLLDDVELPFNYFVCKFELAVDNVLQLTNPSLPGVACLACN